MKNKLIKILVLSAIFAPAVNAEDDVTSQTMLDEIADLRQKQQLEQARVDMLTVKQKRIELELSNETASMAEPLPVDSTSFDMDESGSMAGQPGLDGDNAPPADGPESFAQWDVPGGMNAAPAMGILNTETPPEMDPELSRVKLLNVVGFSDNLKASILVDGTRKTVKVGDKIRGTSIVVKTISFDYIEIEENGKSRFVDFAGGPDKNSVTPLIPAQGGDGQNNFMTGGSDFSGPGTAGSIEQPLPIIE